MFEHTVTFFFYCMMYHYAITPFPIGSNNSMLYAKVEINVGKITGQ